MSFESFIALENKDAVIASLQGIAGEIQENVIATLKDGGKEIKQGLKDSFPIAQHIANMSAYDIDGYMRSVPGGVPMSQTGQLKESIYSKIMPLLLGEAITLKIGTFGYAFYGHILEFGSTKMAARPWFYSGIARLVPSMKGQLETMLSKVISRRNTLRGDYISRGRMSRGQAFEEGQKDIAKFQDFQSNPTNEI